MASGHTREMAGEALARDPAEPVRGYLLIPPDREPDSQVAGEAQLAANGHRHPATSSHVRHQAATLWRCLIPEQVPWMRVREIWLHAVDLDAGARLADLPAEVIDAGGSATTGAR